MKIILIAKIKIASSEVEDRRRAFIDYFSKDPRFEICGGGFHTEDDAWVKIRNTRSNCILWLQENGSVLADLDWSRGRDGLLTSSAIRELNGLLDKFFEGEFNLLPEIADLFYYLRKPLELKEYSTGEEDSIRLTKEDLETCKNQYRQNGAIFLKVEIDSYVTTTDPDDWDQVKNSNLWRRDWTRSKELQEDLGIPVPVWIS